MAPNPVICSGLVTSALPSHLFGGIRRPIGPALQARQIAGSGRDPGCSSSEPCLAPVSPNSFKQRPGRSRDIYPNRAETLLHCSVTSFTFLCFLLRFVLGPGRPPETPGRPTDSLRGFPGAPGPLRARVKKHKTHTFCRARLGGLGTVSYFGADAANRVY